MKPISEWTDDALQEEIERGDHGNGALLAAEVLRLRRQVTSLDPEAERYRRWWVKQRERAEKAERLLDTALARCSQMEIQRDTTCVRNQELAIEVKKVREQLRLCNIDQANTEAALAEWVDAHERELAWKRSFDLLATCLCRHHGWKPEMVRFVADLELIDRSER